MTQRPHPSGKVVSVRLTPELEGRLDALAERTHRSRGMYLRLALELALPQLEKEHWQHTVRDYEEKAIERMFREITMNITRDENEG